MARSEVPIPEHLSQRQFTFPDLNGARGRIGETINITPHTKVRMFGQSRQWVSENRPGRGPNFTTCQTTQATIRAILVDETDITSAQAECNGCDAVWPSSHNIEKVRTRRR